MSHGLEAVFGSSFLVERALHEKKMLWLLFFILIILEKLSRTQLYKFNHLIYNNNYIKTKPWLFRLICYGCKFYKQYYLHALKPPMPLGTITASVPPARIISDSPLLI